MATQVKTPQQEALERLVARGRQDSEHARRLLGGDPQHALAAFVRETYDQELLAQTLRDMIEHGPGWAEDDSVDER